MLIREKRTIYFLLKVIRLCMIFCAGLLLSLSASAGKNTQDIPDLLSEMSQSLRNLNYQGRFVYLVEGDLKSFQIQHALIDGLEYERLVFLNKKQQEVVRIGHNVFCIHPGNTLLRDHAELISNPFANKSVNLDQGLYTNYVLTVESSEENTEVISGYDTYAIHFKSRNDNLYDHSLWLEQNSKLLLKVVISDEDLGILESFEFVQVSIGEKIDRSVFENSKVMQHKADHLSPEPAREYSGEQIAESISWQASWLPGGFSSAGRTRKVLKDQSGAIEMLMYTDGLSAISIFIDPVEQYNQSDDPSSGSDQYRSEYSESSQLGALSTYSQVLPWQGSFYRVTVVGNIHLKAAERIAKGVVAQ